MIDSPSADLRVQLLLDQLDLKYEVDADGDFRVLFAFEGGRSQVAFIRSETARFDNLDIREVFSVGLITNGPLSAQVANALLVYNAHVKMGSWRLARQEGGRCVVAFAVQLAANTDAPSLLAALRVAATTADEIEAKLTSADSF